VSSSAGLGPLLLLLAGTSARFRLIFLEDDGSPVDLTGATALKFVIKRDAYIADTYAIVTKVLADFTLTPLSGWADFAIAASETATDEPWGDYFYYAEVTLPSGRVLIPDKMRGPAKLDAEDDDYQSMVGPCIVRLDAPYGTAPEVSAPFQLFTVSITPGVDTMAITFPIAYSPLPPTSVGFTLTVPVGLGSFTVVVRASSITATGCIVDFGAPAPAGCSLTFQVFP
jgi:hypothetical protein